MTFPEIRCVTRNPAETSERAIFTRVVRASVLRGKNTFQAIRSRDIMYYYHCYYYYFCLLNIAYNIFL